MSSEEFPSLSSEKVGVRLLYFLWIWLDFTNEIIWAWRFFGGGGVVFNSKLIFFIDVGL